LPKNYNFNNAILKTMLLQNYSTNLIEAGTDEAGRGCLAGPVTAAAVILPENFESALINDSKQLSEKTRETKAYY
jgi:ribonuclease HII